MYLAVIVGDMIFTQLENPEGECSLNTSVGALNLKSCCLKQHDNDLKYTSNPISEWLLRNIIYIFHMVSEIALK